MTEIVGAAAADSLATDSNGVISRLLGPTADVMGEQLRARYVRWTNARKVVDRAAERVDLTQDGGISHRVVEKVLNEAQAADNVFLSEYLSGVLASARSKAASDDSAVPWTALVGRLSSDDLALHWSLYRGVQESRVKSDEEFWDHLGEQRLVEANSLLLALGWDLLQESVQRATECFYSLQREGLIEDLSHGAGKYLRNDVSYTRGAVLDESKFYWTFRPTERGVSLLIRALGFSGKWMGEFFQDQVSRAVRETPDLPGSPTVRMVSQARSSDDDTSPPEPATESV